MFGFRASPVRAGEDVPIGAVLGWVVVEEIVSPLDALIAPGSGANGHDSLPATSGGCASLSPAFHIRTCRAPEAQSFRCT